MWDVTSWHPDTKTTKFEPQTNGHQTAKQHGLAGSTDPFLNHISPGPGGKTSRLDPLKNCTLLVRLSWSPYSCPIQNAFETRPWFCSDKVKARPGRFTKPIFRNCSWCDILTPTHQNHQIRAPNGRPPNSYTAWPGRCNGSMFEPHFPQPRRQNVTPGSTKNLYGFGTPGSTKNLYGFGYAFTVSLQLSYTKRTRNHGFEATR